MVTFNSLIPVDGLTAGCLETGAVCGRKSILVGAQRLDSSQNTITAKCAFGHLGNLLRNSSLNVQSFDLAHSWICVLKEEPQIKHFVIHIFQIILIFFFLIE